MYHKGMKRAEMMLSGEKPGVQDAWMVLRGSNCFPMTFWLGKILEKEMSFMLAHCQHSLIFFSSFSKTK